MFKPKLPSIVKLPRYKSFTYTPIYFNEEEEDLKERVRLAQKGQEGRPTLVTGDLRDKWQRNKQSGTHSFSGYYAISPVRIIVIIAALTLGAWYLLN